ncbi:hypothetical protein DFJ73DRAFT_833576 [Zopfochytrium polystomum]|nr:hypothetical protein DFJ73DRAFT_833576 [Zopfochytrium polystomum]
MLVDPPAQLLVPYARLPTPGASDIRHPSVFLEEDFIPFESSSPLMPSAAAGADIVVGGCFAGDVDTTMFRISDLPSAPSVSVASATRSLHSNASLPIASARDSSKAYRASAGVKDEPESSSSRLQKKSRLGVGRRPSVAALAGPGVAGAEYDDDEEYAEFGNAVSLATMEGQIDLKNHSTRDDTTDKQRGFRNTVMAVEVICRHKLYRERGIKSLESYFKEVWKISRAQVYRFLDCAAVIKQLEDFVIIPSRERLCRSLKRFAKTRPDLRMLWCRVLESVNGFEREITSSTVAAAWELALQACQQTPSLEPNASHDKRSVVKPTASKLGAKPFENDPASPQDEVGDMDENPVKLEESVKIDPSWSMFFDAEQVEAKVRPWLKSYNSVFSSNSLRDIKANKSTHKVARNGALKCVLKSSLPDLISPFPGPAEQSETPPLKAALDEGSGGVDDGVSTKLSQSPLTDAEVTAIQTAFQLIRDRNYTLQPWADGVGWVRSDEGSNINPTGKWRLVPSEYLVTGRPPAGSPHDSHGRLILELNISEEVDSPPAGTLKGKSTAKSKKRKSVESLDALCEGKLKAAKLYISQAAVDGAANLASDNIPRRSLENSNADSANSWVDSPVAASGATTVFSAEDPPTSGPSVPAGSFEGFSYPTTPSYFHAPVSPSDDGFDYEFSGAGLNSSDSGYADALLTERVSSLNVVDSNPSETFTGRNLLRAASPALSDSASTIVSSPPTIVHSPIEDELAEDANAAMMSDVRAQYANPIPEFRWSVPNRHLELLRDA